MTEKIKIIRDLIKKYRIEDALNELEILVEKTNDKELDKELLTLISRYNREKIESRLSINTNSENESRIIYSITQMLSEVQDLILEKSSLEVKIKQDDLENERKSTSFLALDHGIPYYPKNNLTLRDIGEVLFIQIPKVYVDKFKEYKFEVRPFAAFNEDFSLSEYLKGLGIGQPNELLENCTHEVAQEFLGDLRNGEMRFNGLMYGLKKLRSERLNAEEEAGMDISFYKTDYFTFRVFARIYQKLTDRPDLFKIEKLSDINLYFPFLSGLGLGTFVIINRGKGDEILLGQRSNSVIVDKGKWHYSMNEAFSMNDIDEFKNPSLSACLFRGLKEELGISEKFKRNVVQFEFLDFIMNTDRFEIGFTSFVRLELNHILSFENLMEFYSIAQDGKLETSSIRILPVKEIDQFLVDNYDNISVVCYGALKTLNARYKAGYIRDEN